MNVDSATESRLSFFPNVTATAPTAELSLGSYIKGVASGRWKNSVNAYREAKKRGDDAAAKDLKKRLPCITPAGLFSQRRSSGLAYYSGIIVVDIDKVGTQEARLLLQRARSDQTACAGHISPTGDGLKLFFRSMSLPESHGDSWEVAAAHVAEFYGGIVNLEGRIDPGSDVARLCYVSWDPSAFARASVPLASRSTEKTLDAAPSNTSGEALQHLTPPIEGVTLENVYEQLHELSPDVDYQTWIKICAAMRHQFRSDVECSEAREVFESWSSEGDKYRQGDGYKAWDSLTPNPLDRNPVTILTLFHLVKEQRAQRAVAVEKSEQAAILAWLKSVQFNVASPPPKEECRFKLAGRDISTPGNFTVISAPIKSGKSNFIGAGLASTFPLGVDPLRRWDERPDFLGWDSDGNPHGQAVLHFDTEQSRGQHDMTIRRAMKRAGAVTTPEWFGSWCITGETAAKQLRAVMYVVKHITVTRQIHSIWIDGIGDLVTSPNEEVECNALVAELRGLALATNAPIICSLHWNPGTEKTRGHLGSELERKAQSVLRMDKTKDGAVKVTMPLKSRGAPINDSDAPIFAWSDAHGLHVSLCTAATPSKRPGAPSQYDLLQILGPDTLPRLELKQRAIKAGMSVATFNRLLKKGLDDGTVVDADKRFKASPLLTT